MNMKISYAPLEGVRGLSAEVCRDQSARMRFAKRYTDVAQHRDGAQGCTQLNRSGMLRVLLTVVCALFALTACAKPEPVYLTEYRDVYIPVKCEITSPPRPQYQENAAVSAAALIQYAKELELAIRACK